MKSIFIIVLIVLFGTTQIYSFKIPGISYPFHASCKIKWNFPQTDCKLIKSKILAQINAWNNENCGTTQKCLYALVDNDDDEIKATHTTPKKRYIDDLKFEFENNNDECEVKGFSESRLWYALLDFGTNYCNLHNLVKGAELNNIEGFTETTRDKICTQYSSADCEKY